MKTFTPIFLIILIAAGSAFSQSGEQAVPEKTRILFLLDGSGSMLAHWGGGQTRMDVAKRILAETTDSLQGNPKLELGLRVYGHLYPSRQNNCTDSRLEVAFSPDNHQQIKTKLLQISPKGNTPIAYSLEQAAGDFPVASGFRNIIIIITDGIESCEGDPCTVSLALQKKNIFLKPFVIALGDQKGFQHQFDCIGTTFDATSIVEFRKSLRKALKQSLGKTTVSVELLNEEHKPVETDINLTFQNSFTGEAAYNFVHYRNARGITDTLRIDPVLSYNLLVQTLPQLSLQNIQFTGGEHNTINVKVTEGELKIIQKSYREYKNGVQALIRKSGSQEIFHTQPMGSTVSYLSGVYDVEILTLPRTRLNKVEIYPGKETTLEIPPPGIANIRADFSGIGDVYEMDPNGIQQELIFKLDEKSPVNSFALQPGKYRLVFRAKNAQGSKYTKVRDFEVKSGSSTNINLLR